MDLYQGTEVNLETQSLLYDWFQFREINDDEKFPVFFKRYLNRTYGTYKLKAELQLQKIPEFTNYAEAYWSTDNSTDTNKSNNTRTGTYKDSGSDITTGTNNSLRTNSNDIKTEHRGNDTVENNDTNTNEQLVDRDIKHMVLNGPQSASYPAAVSGTMPAMDWQFISAQDETKENNGKTQTKDEGTNTTTYNSDDSTNSTGSENISGDTTNKTTYGKNNTTSESNDGITEAKHDGKHEEMRSGRNELETEIRKKISSYLNNSIAFDWFRKELEVCFMGVY